MRFVYLSVNMGTRCVRVMEHEDDHGEFDHVVRVGVSDHESISVDVKQPES